MLTETERPNAKALGLFGSKLIQERRHKMAYVRHKATNRAARKQCLTSRDFLTNAATAMVKTVAKADGQEVYEEQLKTVAEAIYLVSGVEVSTDQIDAWFGIVADRESD